MVMYCNGCVDEQACCTFVRGAFAIFCQHTHTQPVLQMDPRDCKVLHYGNSQGMGLIAVKVVALLASGMRIFIFPKIADQQTKEQAKRAKDQLTMAQVSQIGVCLWLLLTAFRQAVQVF